MLDERRLARDLAACVRGEVRFFAGTSARYSTDACNYRQLPVGVVVPRDTEDVVSALAVCRDHGAPVQPGQILDRLRRGTESGAPRLTFGQDPATHDHCALAGMIGNNSCGVHSVVSAFYGPGPRTSDNVVSPEIITYDGVRREVGPTNDDELERPTRVGVRHGEIYPGLRALRDDYGALVRSRYPDIPRRVSSSIAAGERVLLRAVRRADARTLILADGFSCREQVRQRTDRQALHLTEILQSAGEQAGGRA